MRLTRSLEILRSATLPESFTNSIKWLIWSSTSDKLLVATSDVIRVVSASNSKFSATITNPTSETAKVTHIVFGASDEEVWVFADFGLKATVFNLRSSTSIDIASPKFFHPGVAGKGISYRSTSSHCALLSRSGGKDVISIHKPVNYEIVNSWNPDTVDAQSLTWSPNGLWLAIVESSGQGHKVLFYTPDGHLYRTWKGPVSDSDTEKDYSMGAGVRLIEWNTSGHLLALGDHTSRITVLSTTIFSTAMCLDHTTTINPSKGLKVWQEQILPVQTGFERTYSLVTQITAPPTTETSPAGIDSAAKIGTNILAFDASGTLLATRAENMPTTIWIWDLATRVLKTAMIQHAPVAKLSWHPYINELLMIRCEGDECRGLVHLWEPTWDSPKVLDFSSQVPEGKLLGKTVARWLMTDNQLPALFFSDTQDFMLAVITEEDEVELPWQELQPKLISIYGDREESPLNLVQAGEKVPAQITMQLPASEETEMWTLNDTSEVDDTFSFKKHG